jgi:hypothetical protein
VDFLPGVTDLAVSRLTVVRAGEDLLPLVAPILYSLVSQAPIVSPTTVPDRLAEAGVLVVTPEELLAALNPEFMIGFAEPPLGAGHVALAEARAQMDDGRYFDALLTVRAALASQ